MVKRGDLPEPSSAAHLAKLNPLKRVGGGMSTEACQDPEKAKYIGECCGGRRVWGELGADIYIDDKRTNGGPSFVVAPARRRCPGCRCPRLLHRRHL